MAGIYIHIPFCKQACTYCDFHFSINTKKVPDIIDAIKKELVIQKKYLGNAPINTLYFGGGTPTILIHSQLEEIFKVINDHYNLTPDAEVTMEANPDDLDSQKIQELILMGVNRLSIGIQSFEEEHLRFMNRAHSAEQAKNCVLTAYQNGIANISIDLIYGIPNMTLDQWKNNIETALGLPISHISCYCLTIEEKTLLKKWVDTKKVIPADDQSIVTQYNLLVTLSQQKGFEHYEISNFSLPGFQSRHNSNYWNGEVYLGIGPSAHSFNGSSRQWNISSNQAYIDSINNGKIFFEIEEITLEMKFNELIITRLRTSKGLTVLELEKNLPDYHAKQFYESINKYSISGHVKLSRNKIYITEKGWLISDTILTDLII